MAKYADVIIDISRGQLDKSFQYRIPAELEDRIRVGSQVRVSFGSDRRKIRGYVIGISEKAKLEEAKIRPIDGTVRDAIDIESQLISLAVWMKDHYGSTLNQALKTVLPIKVRAAAREKKSLRLLLPPEEARGELACMRARKRHSVAKERLLEALIQDQNLPWELVAGELNIPPASIRDLEKRGWLAVESFRSMRNPLAALQKSEKRIWLNEQQEQAFQAFAADWDLGRRGTYLLYGVTGSGKTQVYMEMIAKVLSQGKEAIVLIPEISLTYQTVMRFYSRFGDQVSILNSRMSAGERSDQFERAKEEKVRIMVGPRSALFTPFPNLGLIVIDEEHENSYKSETVPKYHARETATERARLSSASVVLGSATPSLEAFFRAKRGEYSLLSLPSRVENRALPDCQIVDLREELREGNRSVISRRLGQLIEDRLKKKEQIMLFINRRGMAGFVSCRSCGSVIKCPHCEVALTLHQNGRMSCHYCGYSMPAPRTCPKCGSRFIGGMRAGTEKFEEVIRRTFPGARVLRMDADTTRSKGGYQRILGAFANQEADILIGTQMIVKGHDFPNVTLVAALAADLSLNSSDFRGAERTFQLLCQAAGRAGRGDRPGKMVIQTYQPGHFAIVDAARQDYESFYDQEMAYRSLMSYPPAAHMLVVQIMSDSEQAAESAAALFAELLRRARPGGRIDGPVKARIAKLADVYRQAIYIRDEDYDLLIEDKNRIEDRLLADRSLRAVNVWFDFDPMNAF